MKPKQWISWLTHFLEYIRSRILEFFRFLASPRSNAGAQIEEVIEMRDICQIKTAKASNWRSTSYSTSTRETGSSRLSRPMLCIGNRFGSMTSIRNVQNVVESFPRNMHLKQNASGHCALGNAALEQMKIDGFEEILERQESSEVWSYLRIGLRTCLVGLCSQRGNMLRCLLRDMRTTSRNPGSIRNELKVKSE